MRKWYEEGLIDEEFVSQKYDGWTAKITGDKVGMFFCFPDSVGSWEDSIKQTLKDNAYGNPDDVCIYGLVPLKGIDGVPYTYDNDNAMVSFAGANQPTVITTAAVKNGHIEKCLELLNYLYSEEGSELNNWGVEGVSYTKDADGTHHWTEAVTNDPDYGMADAVFKYALPTLGGWPKAMSYEAWGSMNLVVPDQITTHKNYALSDTSLDIPSFALNAEEQETYSRIITDVNTAVSEVYLSVITGKKDVAELDALLAQVKSMGIGDAVAAYQSAYDRYMNR
jgi:putative aldouronate transport system substrate-binding protein